MLDSLLDRAVKEDVERALAEDIGDGDITAKLIPADQQARAKVISRESAIICGHRWVQAVFDKIVPDGELEWTVAEGRRVEPDAQIMEMQGNARSLLTAERTMLNFLQTLSGTATTANGFAEAVKHTKCKILDTRKTLPGLRIAQKYAVRCGGAQNHRLGLWDAFLIKENHIAACGSIKAAVREARQTAPGKPVEVEVESLTQLEEALAAKTDIVMLDNFNLADMRVAVARNAGQAKLEASGNVEADSLVSIAETGVDFISIGAITKHCRAIDLSMRFVD